MTTYMVTMTRIDRRTSAVVASTRALAERMAKDEFRFASEDPLADEGEIQIVSAEAVCMECSEPFDDSPDGVPSPDNPDLCVACVADMATTPDDDELCDACDEPFAESGPAGRSRVDPSMCEFCYVNEDEEGMCKLCGNVCDSVTASNICGNCFALQSYEAAKVQGDTPSPEQGDTPSTEQGDTPSPEQGDTPPTADVPTGEVLIYNIWTDDVSLDEWTYDAMEAIAIRQVGLVQHAGPVHVTRYIEKDGEVQTQENFQQVTDAELEDDARFDD